jgi:N-acetylmuramoyl-L-alanine amidase
MSVKIYLSPSDQPDNVYAAGGTNEKAQMEAVAGSIKNILDTEYACETVMAAFSLGIGIDGRPREAKDKGCHVYLAVHSNAGGGGRACGAVAYYHPGSLPGQILATKIVDELGAICPVASNRSTPVESGMKAFNGQGFGEIRNPASLGLIAVLAETDFHDNPQTAQWIVSNKDVIARAYVNALVNTFNITKKQAAKPVETGALLRYYRVQLGAYAKPENAEAMQKKLKSLGFDAIIKYE